MAAGQEKTNQENDDHRAATKNIGQDAASTIESDPRFRKIDRTAPAGSENSLGAESVRDGRPATDDSTVEAMDEEGPGISPLDSGKSGS